MPKTHGQGNPVWTFEETILALNVLHEHAFKVPAQTSDDVERLSRLLQALPIHAIAERTERFRNTDGVYLKLQNLVSMHPHRAGRGLRHSAMDRNVWEAYWQNAAEVRRLAAVIEAGAQELRRDVGALDQEELFPEGQLLTAIHTRRERARGLRAQVIERERKRGLACQACRREPALATRCADLEDAMYEVHHTVPLSEIGVTKTRLADVVLLCATCHRLIHALIRSEKRWCSIADLRVALRINYPEAQG